MFYLALHACGMHVLLHRSMRACYMHVTENMHDACMLLKHELCMVLKHLLAGSIRCSFFRNAHWQSSV